MRNRLFLIALALLACVAPPAAAPAPVKIDVAKVPDQQIETLPEPRAPDMVLEAEVPLPPPKVLVGRKILVVGDSEACAVNLYIRKTVKEINEAEGHPLDEVSVECKGGTTVQYWGDQGHLAAALSKHPNPDAIVVFLGTNHYWQTVEPPVQPVLDLIDQSEANCVWVGNTAVKGKRWKINKILESAVTPTCTYYDTEAHDIALGDGVHPTGGGALKWIRTIWPMIPLKYEDGYE